MNKNELQNSLNEMLLDLKLEEKADNTIKKYRHNVQHFIDSLPDGEITKQDVINFKSDLVNQGYKTTTNNSYIVSVNKFLKYCELSDLRIKQIKQQEKTSLECIISMTDYKRLLRYAKKLGRMDMYYIMEILAYTGIRISELKYFTYENIQKNYISVYNKGKERDIILRQDLHRDLKKYAREQKIKTGYLFPGQNKNRLIHESTIWRQLKRIAGKARVNKDKVHAHSFRHLFAKMFLEEYPGNITELADILGHSQLETTRIYTRTTSEEKRKHLERINFKRKTNGK